MHHSLLCQLCVPWKLGRWMELWCQQIEHLPSFFSVITFAFQIKVFPPDSWYDKSKTVMECRVEGCMLETRCLVFGLTSSCLVFLFCCI